MTLPGLDRLSAALAQARPVRPVGRIAAFDGRLAHVAGLDGRVALGDLVEIAGRRGEVVALDDTGVVVLPEVAPEGVRLGDMALLYGPPEIRPDDSWLGRVVDPFGQPMDGRPVLPGPVPRPYETPPPDPTRRRGFGARLDTGFALFNTLLGLARGQRIGLFAGAGVGKSTLLSGLAQGVEADVVVLALVGERGREVRHFVEDVLGPAGLARSVVVAATSDTSPLVRRRALPAALAVAEHFRDAGLHVFLLADSVTRHAEAHREVALSVGEGAHLRGFPPSTAQKLAALSERAGPGAGAQGDITAVFSVLVEGSDMDGPVADILRGVLDGHVVLDRAIAERGRFPAVDVLRSLSRALPDITTEGEAALATRARELLGAYANGEIMVKSGLYEAGADPLLDAAVRAWPGLDAFAARRGEASVAASFKRLAEVLKAANAL